MLTMLLPTRIVTRSRCGLSFSRLTVSAPGRPSSTSVSIRWLANENMAISDEEKNPDNAINTRIVNEPATTKAVSLVGTLSTTPPSWSRTGGDRSIRLSSLPSRGLRIVLSPTAPRETGG